MTLSATVSAAPPFSTARMADNPSLSEFNLPITNLGPPKPAEWETLGHHHPPMWAVFGDPLNDPEAKRRLEEYKANPIRWDAVDGILKDVKLQKLTKDMVSGLKRAVFQPELLLEHPTK